MKKNYNLSESETARILKRYDRIKKVLDDCYKITDKTFTEQRWNCDSAAFLLPERADYILRVESEFYDKMIKKCFKLYKMINEVIPAYSLNEIEDMRRQPFKVSHAFGFQYTDGRLYVKLPHFIRRLKDRNGGMMFENEFRAMLTDFFRHLPGRVSFKDKLIYIVNVYPDNTNSLFVPDNDKYDFKRVVDIITDFTGGGDSAFHCSYMLMSVSSNDVPDASYVIVQDGEAEVLSKSKIFADMAVIFGTKTPSK